MKKNEYGQIFWGIALMAIVFATPFVIPRVGKMLTSIYPVKAQTSGVILTFFEPPSGLPGSVLTLYGSGFTSTSNTVHFGNIDVTNLNSSDGTTITLDVPTVLPNTSTPLPAGDYAITVSNANGDSNAYAYTVICDASDCGTPGPGGPFTGELHLCTGYFNCVMGFKVPIGGVADAQTVTIDGQFSATTTSYDFDEIPTGLHTVSITVPANWYSGFTLCVNNISCHNQIPIQGDSVSINFLASRTVNPSVSNGVISVPAGSYVDLYWHFSQNFGDFGGDPGDLLPPGGGTATTSSSTPPFSGAGTRQAVAYTSGNTSGTGIPGIGTLQGLQAASQNVLGCNNAQILSPAIRNAIAGSVPPPAADTARGGGGGGASIIINDIGSTGPLRQYLYKIAASTRQQEINSSVTRAANVGIGNNPSWDAVSYCLENSMVKYVNQSAKNWLNTAFNGNPAFVQNLTTFLTGISDQQAENFFQQVKGLNANSTIQPWVYQNLVNSYTATYSQLSRYTLGDYSSNPQAFLNGDWSQGGWEAQKHAFDAPNFYYSALWMAKSELSRRVDSAQYAANQNLNWGQGVFNETNCDQSSGYGSVSGTNCVTTVPGSIVREIEVNRLTLPETRAAFTGTQFNQSLRGLMEQLPQNPGETFNGAGQI